MAGVNVGGGGGKRRSLDSEINMIPMIDLLMVTISFLLITAVWVQYKTMPANANVPGSATSEPPCPDCKDEAKLHVETSDPAKFVLAWKQGKTVLRTVDVPRESRKPGGVAFPNLAAKIADEWNATGTHRQADDRHFDQAVVHAPNDMAYADLIGVMDAVSEPRRAGALRAFSVTFAVD